MTKTQDGSMDELVESSAYNCSSTRRHIFKNDENTPPIKMVEPGPEVASGKPLSTPPPSKKTCEIILENVEPEVVGSTSAADNSHRPQKRRRLAILTLSNESTRFLYPKNQTVCRSLMSSRFSNHWTRTKFLPRPRAAAIFGMNVPFASGLLVF